MVGACPMWTPRQSLRPKNPCGLSCSKRNYWCQTPHGQPKDSPSDTGRRDGPRVRGRQGGGGDTPDGHTHETPDGVGRTGWTTQEHEHEELHGQVQPDDGLRRQRVHRELSEEEQHLQGLHGDLQASLRLPRQRHECGPSPCARGVTSGAETYRPARCLPPPFPRARGRGTGHVSKRGGTGPPTT